MLISIIKYPAAQFSAVLPKLLKAVEHLTTKVLESLSIIVLPDWSGSTCGPWSSGWEPLAQQAMI